MTPAQHELVRDSWHRAAPAREQVIRDFYDHLFEQAPTLRELFPADLGRQKRKLLITLNIAVSRLSQLEHIRPSLRELGRRHRDYGARTKYYPVVCEALLWSLATHMGSDFDRATEFAWREALSIITTEMLAGAQEDPDPAG